MPCSLHPPLKWQKMCPGVKLVKFDLTHAPIISKLSIRSADTREHRLYDIYATSVGEVQIKEKYSINRTVVVEEHLY